MEDVDSMASRQETEMAWALGGGRQIWEVKQQCPAPLCSECAQGVSEVLTDHDRDLGPPGLRKPSEFWQA